MKEQTLMGRYIDGINGGHSFGSPQAMFDTKMRLILKDHVFNTSICSHDAIIYRETTKGKNPENFCRICSRDMNKDEVMRCNDYLVLRNKKCPSAICGDCIKNKPDNFYKAYKRAADFLRQESDFYHTVDRELKNIEKTLEKMLKELK